MVIALLFVTIGFISGALISLLWVERERKSREAETRERPNPKLDPLITEISLLRDPANGKLVTRVDGELVAGAEDLTSEQRQRLVKLVKEFVSWMGILPSTKLPTQPQPPETTRPENLAQPQPRPAAAPLTPHPKLEPTASSGAARSAPTSIVAQIDEILQEMLDSAGLTPMSIKLTEDPTDGVVVWIGASRFVGIDGVTDPEHKAILKAAVAEWERRQEPDRNR